eukprot:TRINITY_DN2335_c0_g1_i1.p1 TRINITY_DN2335_c0_g1~~TRINITY_DN2335_c0_g1_i1.p1  ORF type:complete len:149 (+),score=33.99 TRINITY_DN2335_c0_g1_i1:59-448(+)
MTAFQSVLTKKTNQFVIYRVDKSSNTIVVDREAKKGASFKEFTSALPEAEGRYAVYDYTMTHKDGTSRSKVLFVVWAPDNAPIKDKMLIASSKDSFKKKLVGVALEIQATDWDEIAESAIQEKILSFAK